MEKLKKSLFFLLVLALSVFNYEIMYDWNYIERILIRIPQVLIILYLYRRYICKDNPKRKYWRIQNNITHYGLLALGIIEFIMVIILSNTYLKNIRFSLSQFNLTDPNFYNDLLVDLIISIPIYYAFIQYLLILYKLNLWAYDRNKFFLILVLIVDDLFFTLAFSTIG